MRTRVDEFLLASLPSFLTRDLLFDLSNLCANSVMSLYPVTITRYLSWLMTLPFLKARPRQRTSAASDPVLLVRP